jgi:prevent-host-death family protein
MKSVTLRDIKNNPAIMTKYLANGEPVFVTKHGKPIGVTLPLDDSIVNQSLKEILFFDLYKKGEISFSKLAQFLGVRKDKLRKMFASLNIPVIDYEANEVLEELEAFKDL